MNSAEKNMNFVTRYIYAKYL